MSLLLWAGLRLVSWSLVSQKRDMMADDDRLIPSRNAPRRTNSTLTLDQRLLLFFLSFLAKKNSTEDDEYWIRSLCIFVDIFFRWQVIHHSECSAHCGQGVRNVTKQCIQQSLQEPSVSVPVDDYLCGHLKDLPPETEPCMGSCNKTHWQFLPWSQVKTDNHHTFFSFTKFLLLLSDFVWKTVFAIVRWWVSISESSLRRFERAYDCGSALRRRGENRPASLPHWKLSSMGSWRMDTGKSCHSQLP